MRHMNLLLRIFMVTTLLITSMIPIGAKASSMNSTQKKYLAAAETEYKNFMNYGPNKVQLDKWSDIVTTKKIAESIYNGSARETFKKAYSKAKSSGLTTSNNSSMKKMRDTYGHTLSYLEAVIAIENYYTSVSTTKLTTATSAKSLGATSNKDASKKRGKAYKEYQDLVKRKENSSNSKRAAAMVKKYTEVTNYLLGVIELESFKSNIKPSDTTSSKKTKAKKVKSYIDKLPSSSKFRPLILNEYNKHVNGDSSTGDTPSTNVTEEAVVTATSLNVRKGPGTSYAVVKSVKKNEKYDVISKKTGWVQISWKGGNGWVSSEYVKIQKKPTTSTVTEEAVITADTLNIRKGAGTSYDIVKKAKKNEVYDVVEKKSGWVKISWKGGNGWGSADYMKIRKKSDSSSNDGSSSGSGSTVNKTAVVTADRLNLRKSNSNTSEVLTQIPYGTQIKITEIKGDWGKTTYNKQTGYVHTGYISYDLNSTVTSYTVLADKLNVYSSENKSSSVIYTAKKGEKLKVTIKDGNWYTISLSNGKTGYVYILDNKPAVNPSKPLSGYTILLDAGHGGSDPGSKGYDGVTYEKTLNLQMALLVRAQLWDLGADVEMTRTGDTYPTLTDRTNQSNKLKPDAFVSLHHDSATSTATGFTVFYYHAQHRELSNAVNSSMDAATDLKNRGSKYGNYHVLRENKYPAILIEFGFITNPMELELLKSSTYQKTMAKAVANGIKNYFTK